MKKLVCLLLILAMALSFAGCSFIDDKIEEKEDQAAAAKVMEKIMDLGTITIESRIPIEKAEKAYNALSEKAKALVTNYQDLVEARKTFLALRRQAIVDRVEEAKKAFEESYNTRVYFLTLADIRKDCHEGEFDVVDDAVKEAEAMCYEGTHFIDFVKYLELEGSIKTTDGKTYSYKAPEDGKTYKATFAKITEAYGVLKNVSFFHNYRFRITGSNNTDAAKVWGAASELYAAHLRQYIMKEEKLDWGLAEEIGKYDIVYADDLGNEIKAVFNFEGANYYYQLIFKKAE